MSATPETLAQVQANAANIVQQIRGGANFQAYARQFSEASTAARGGELGWVRAEQLPEALAATVRTLPVGAVSDPVAIPGGFSIMAVSDTRQVLTADPRDAQLSLKQISIGFAPGTPQAQAQQRVQEFVRAVQSMGGCGAAEATAAPLKAEVVTNDQVKVRDLPPALQPVLLGLQVGQTTAPFGAVTEKVSVLVLCGRDDPPPVAAVSDDTIRNQLSEERVNLRARRYLRDLRRDAVVDYR
jgi:peptidyl-prolyl cis-trans isomerase SurA